MQICKLHGQRGPKIKEANVCSKQDASQIMGTLLGMDTYDIIYPTKANLSSPEPSPGNNGTVPKSTGGTGFFTLIPQDATSLKTFYYLYLDLLVRCLEKDSSQMVV